MPNFQRLNKKQKIHLILNGVDPENIEFNSTNATLTYTVQQYILSTTRFTDMEE